MQSPRRAGAHSCRVARPPPGSSSRVMLHARCCVVVAPRAPSSRIIDRTGSTFCSAGLPAIHSGLSLRRQPSRRARFAGPTRSTAPHRQLRVKYPPAPEPLRHRNLVIAGKICDLPRSTRPLETVTGVGWPVPGWWARAVLVLSQRFGAFAPGPRIGAVGAVVRRPGALGRTRRSSPSDPDGPKEGVQVA
jgi:hypothetical protein